MTGPPPKKPSTRQRRNKSSSRAILPSNPSSLLSEHPLPDFGAKKKKIWHPMAVKFWESVWQSPMSSEFVPGDEFALYRLLILVDKYFRRGSLEVAKEIRLLEQQFGLTPLSRRRLEWTVTETEEAKDKHEMNRAKRARKMIDGKVEDPRGVLDQ
jgi:hypothetical protein